MARNNLHCNNQKEPDNDQPCFASIVPSFLYSKGENKLDLLEELGERLVDDVQRHLSKLHYSKILYFLKNLAIKMVINLGS